MRAALISSEIAPFAKSGGLADAVAGLARAIADSGVDVVLLMPRYQSVGELDARPVDVVLDVPVAGGRVAADVERVALADRLSLYLIDIPEFFDRPGLYEDDKGPYADNLARFSAFSRASLQLLRALDMPCDVLHAHDWQTALLPFLLRAEDRETEFFARSRSVLTIHNLAFQGNFPAEQYPATGLDPRYFDVRYTEFYGGVNLLKAGVVAADAITTVSPTYALEVLTPEHGAGLEGVLRDRQEDFTGILNGIDATVWDPATDPHFPFHYRAGAPQGKGKCKRALLAEVELPPEPNAPLIGVVSRLVDQKGIDLLVDAVPRLLDTDARWVFLGTGDAEIADGLRLLAARYPDRVAVRIDFDEALAHRIQAGSDYTFMPSRFEPCGLNQLYALRYGTIPIVSNVGGLADTVVDIDESPAEATGVVFSDISVDGVVEAAKRSLALYRKPGVWGALRRRAMECDHSWPSSAARYLDLYRTVLALPPSPIPAGPSSE